MCFCPAPAGIRGTGTWSLRSCAPRGHDVITPDLPADDDSAGLREYTETVVRVLGDRTALIVVAQSMAAFPAPMLCERADVQLLVLVAPMIPSPGESPGAWWTNTGQMTARRRQDEREGRDPDAGSTW